MLITKEVEIVVTSKTTKYYENLGYDIPRILVRQKHVVKRGTKIVVQVSDLPLMSNVIIEYQCDYCGKIKSKAYCDHIRNENKLLSKHSCIDCLSLYRSELNKLEWQEKIKSDIKKCSKCKREFPKTLEYFQKDLSRPDGLSCQCKECILDKEIFTIPKIIIPEGYKKCCDCENILELNENNFKTYSKSKDGFYNICINCQINRRHKDCLEGYKKCKICGRELPINRDFYDEDSRCLDGYRHICRECNNEDFYPTFKADDWSECDKNIIKLNYKDKTISEIIPMLSIKRSEKSIMHMAKKLDVRKINNYVKNYFDFKYKFIDNILHKYCKSCFRYLPCNKDYFPIDENCTDGIRNICRECKGEYFKINSPMHIWTEDEVQLMIKYYPQMTNKELHNNLFNYLSVNQILSKGTNLNLYKNQETLNRMFSEFGKLTSIRFLENEKWQGEDNPQYNSQRYGELNPNYKGGISALSQELRRNIKQWKLDSIENCNYKCFLTNGKFDNIHHLYSFDNIVQDTLNETRLPLYDNISYYSDNELKQLIDKCLEIHYRYPLGVCLAENIHLKFHLEYGYGKNTEEQFYEFLDNYYNGKYKDLKEVI